MRFLWIHHGIRASLSFYLILFIRIWIFLVWRLFGNTCSTSNESDSLALSRKFWCVWNPFWWCLLFTPIIYKGVSLISVQLTGSDNYQIWSRAISDALLVKNKLCFIDETCSRDSVTGLMRSQWDRCNAVVKAWLINSVAKDLVHGMHYNPTTRSIWEDICQHFSKVDGTHIGMS